MDKMLYIAMSGAKQNMHALAVNANNLANAKTTGFKADLAQARSMQAFCPLIHSLYRYSRASPYSRPVEIERDGKARRWYSCRAC